MTKMNTGLHNNCIIPFIYDFCFVGLFICLNVFRLFDPKQGPLMGMPVCQVAVTKNQRIPSYLKFRFVHLTLIVCRKSNFGCSDNVITFYMILKESSPYR